MLMLMGGRRIAAEVNHVVQLTARRRQGVLHTFSELGSGATAAARSVAYSQFALFQVSVLPISETPM
jgi:hypothetical protein